MSAGKEKGAGPGNPTPKTSANSKPIFGQWSSKNKVDFGPFREVDAEAIHLAGWCCKRCKRPVRKFGIVVPNLLPRMMFHACRCVCVSTWEDESGPTPKMWPGMVKLARRRRVQLVMFNGGRDTPAGFQGLN